MGWLDEIGFSGLLDILFMWFVIYALLIWSKRTRSATVLKGMLIVSGVYLLTRQFNMVLASGLLEKFFAIIIIALVVIFQEELRLLFEQIAVWSFRRGRREDHPKTLSGADTDIFGYRYYACIIGPGLPVEAIVNKVIKSAGVTGIGCPDLGAGYPAGRYWPHVHGAYKELILKSKHAPDVIVSPRPQIEKVQNLGPVLSVGCSPDGTVSLVVHCPQI